MVSQHPASEVPSRLLSTGSVFWLLAGAAITAGLVLRLQGIPDQILMDDEWHSLSYATDYSLIDLFTHMGNGATCIPLNVFQRLMLETVGWNETILRLPSLLGGILCLCIIPMFVRSLFSARVVSMVLCLLAVSPYLIFTSRFSRPYSIYLLLSFAAIHAFYMWAVCGRAPYRAVYILSGALAVYFHIFAVIAVVIPAFYAAAMQSPLRPKGEPRSSEFRAPAGGIIWGLATCLGLAGVLLLPALINSSAEFFGSRPRTDPPTLVSFAGFASLLSGSSTTAATVLFCLLWIIGQARLIRANRILGEMFALTTLSYLAAIVVSAPPKMNVPIQMARYCMPIYPMAFICVAVAFDWGWTACARWMSRHFPLAGMGFSHAVIACAAAGLFWVGPLAQNRATVNNFANHAAYQESYQPLKWDRPYHSGVLDYMCLESNRMSEFYRMLEKEKDDVSVVEYPMLIGFHFNIYYFYQHFHKKRVVAGYVSNLDRSLVRNAGDFAYANIPADFVLSGVKDKNKLRFRNMVDLTKKEALLKTQSRYLIIHKNLMAEEIGRSLFQRAYMPAIDLETWCRKEFGEPVFKDQWLTVFGLPTSPNAPP
ncbi:MAG: glycosyltransferase family 39 protein [Verrucomicrobia bacterium]|nr:glycosyltransferase family 39 protein [Verrucomicrobiota bacterium]